MPRGTRDFRRLGRCDHPPSAASPSSPRASSDPTTRRRRYGVIRYGRDDVAAVIDSTRAGQNVDAYLPGHDIPIVATLADALAIEPPPDALLIGIAPTGGRLPQSWRTVILDAIAAGLDVLSGLHTFIGDDPEFAAAAAAAGSTIVDYRRPPERMETAVGRRHAPGKRVILTVGTRLRDRQDVGRPRAPASRPDAAATRSRSCRPARPG